MQDQTPNYILAVHSLACTTGEAICAHTHTRTHAHTRTRTHAHTRTRVFSLSQTRPSSFLLLLLTPYRSVIYYNQLCFLRVASAFVPESTLVYRWFYLSALLLLLLLLRSLFFVL